MFELLLLLSLVGTGMYFNKDNANKLESLNKENIRNNITNRNNIYNNKYFKNSLNNHRRNISNRHRKALSSNNNNIHPNNIRKSNINNTHPHKEHYINNNQKDNLSMKQFGGSLKNNKSNGVYSQLLGKSVLKEEFKHNNMVPFFKKAGMSLGDSNKLFQRKLEMQTGNNQFDKKKKETAPVFKPTMGLTNIHGTQSADLEKYTQNKDRYAIGKNRTNELPFEKEYIQPFEGYNNEYLRDIQEVDARTKLNASVKFLRGESNVSYEGREGPPISYVTKRGQEGHVSKTRPDTFVVDKTQFPISAPVDKGLKRPDCTIVPKTKRGIYFGFTVFFVASSSFSILPIIKSLGLTFFQLPSLLKIFIS